MIECAPLDPIPNVYLVFMRVLAFLSPCCSIIALYCIVRYPANMHTSYRVQLFTYQLSSLLFDFTFSTVACPVIFFPMIMGYSAGLGKYINGAVYPLFVLVVMWISCVDVAIFGMFFCHLQSIIPPSHTLKIGTKGYTLLMSSLYVVFPGSILLTGVFAYAKLARTKVFFKKQFTCASAVMGYVTDAFTYHSLFPIFIHLCVLTTVSFILSVIIAFQSFSAVKKLTNLSEKTRSLQRMFLVRLYMQGLVPTVLFTAPSAVINLIVGSTILFFISYKQSKFSLMHKK
ncbi:hypothetical protein Aduo_003283 [Ancylostoma duodenale]